jgi:hypothetical protein
LSFQFAARRLRVFERGVFHFGFAMIELLRVLAAAGAVALVATGRAQSKATWIAENRERERRVDHLPREILQVELVADEDVVVVERVARVRAGFEPFVDVEFEVEPHVFEAAGALAQCRPADLAVDRETAADATNREIDREDPGEDIGTGIREDEGLVNVERPTGL